MRILCLNQDPSAITFYRLKLPMLELVRHGHEVRFPTRGDKLPSDEELDWAEVIVGRQLSNPAVLPHWDRWGVFAKRVYETDDDLFAVDTTNPALESYLYPGVDDAMRHMIRTADLVTTSTVALAERVQREGAGRVQVLPNCIDRSVWDEPPIYARDPEHPPFSLTVGWAGSSSHSGDWMAHGKPIRTWLLAHPEVDFHMVGVSYLPLLEVPGRHTPWAQPDQFYRNLDFDIGLAPLARTQFNRCKSPIKALEYAALGIPVVATAETAYDEFVHNGVTGFLVEEAADWPLFLTTLAEDATLRLNMGYQARELAKQHTIQERWERWEAAYRSVLG
jgi:glycosyltransferase involved in cell wall biosynthesis